MPLHSSVKNVKINLSSDNIGILYKNYIIAVSCMLTCCDL